MASIAVHREFGGVTDHLRAYKVVVDGAVVGRLYPGESQTFEVSPGSREIFIKVDWARSEKIQMEISAGELAGFRCAPRANALNGIFWASFGWRRYVRLTRVPS